MLVLIPYYYKQNPLHFSFPPEVDAECLMQGAEQLSGAVLRSCEYLLIGALGIAVLTLG